MPGRPTWRWDVWKKLAANWRSTRIAGSTTRRASIITDRFWRLWERRRRRARCTGERWMRHVRRPAIASATLRNGAGWRRSRQANWRWGDVTRQVLDRGPFKIWIGDLTQISGGEPLPNQNFRTALQVHTLAARLAILFQPDRTHAVGLGPQFQPPPPCFQP